MEISQSSNDRSGQIITTQNYNHQFPSECLSSFYSIPNNQSFPNSPSVNQNHSDNSSPASMSYSSSQHFVSIPNLPDSVPDPNQEIIITQFEVIPQNLLIMPSNHQKNGVNINTIQTIQISHNPKSISTEMILVEEIVAQNIQPIESLQNIASEESNLEDEDQIDQKDQYYDDYEQSSEEESESEPESESQYEIESQFNSDQDSEQETTRKRKPNKSYKISKKLPLKQQLIQKGKHSKSSSRKLQPNKKSLKHLPQQSSTQLDAQSLRLSQETLGNRANFRKVEKKKEIRKRKEKQRKKPTSQHYSVFNYIENYFN